MKIAYVHVLPLEYYPPAITALTLLAQHSRWEVRAWTTNNSRRLPAWSSQSVAVRRPLHGQPSLPLPLRVGGYGAWHLQTAFEISRWDPDVLISVEPHSALATWLYYRMFSGKARLFIHHHEYYAPEDFDAPGMRLLRNTRRLEREDLFSRAEWISQTNHHRLERLKELSPAVGKVGRVFPNYPPREWTTRAHHANRVKSPRKTRFLYLGAASLKDTFIEEVARWIAARPNDTSLYVVGNNVAREVWDMLDSMHAPNLQTDREGWPYECIPEKLPEFDVGLVLYRGNTKNFIYNVPNKAIEYLAGGLSVWYPRQMLAMRDFKQQYPNLPIAEMDFDRLPDQVPHALSDATTTHPFAFTAESAIAPLIEAIEHGALAE